MNETVTTYRMNPAEDRIAFGDELKDGMWVLPENPRSRAGVEAPEDERLRGQRFRRVTRLRMGAAPVAGAPQQITFVGEWIDGYQEVYSGAITNGWLVKKDPITAGDENYGIGEDA